MEKNSAGSPLDQTIEQYKRDLMAVYRRSRTPVSPADQPPAPKPARPRPADPPATKPALAEMPPESSHAPEPVHEEPTGDLPEETAPEKAQLSTLGEFLRERIGNPPDNSGTPRDAIGRNEEEYLTAAAAFLRELLARYAEKTSSADNTHHTTNGQNFQPPAATKGEYEQFQQENPDSGVIKTQVFTARRTYPVENAQVNLYKVFPDGAYLIDSQFTDRSGQVKLVTVPALERSLSETPGDPAPYVSYRITVSHPDFMDAVIEQVPVFEGVTSLQAVDLIPAAAAPVNSPDEP